MSSRPNPSAAITSAVCSPSSGAGRRAPTPGVALEVHDVGDDTGRAEVPYGDVGEVAVRGDLRIDDELVVVLHPLVDDLGLRREELGPLGGRLRGERVAHVLADLVDPVGGSARPDALGDVVPARVEHDLGPVDEEPELVPRLVGHRDREQERPAVLGLVDAVRAQDVRVVLAVAVQRLVAHGRVGDLPRLDPHQRTERRCVDLLAEAGALAGVERGHDPEGQLHRPGVIGDGGAGRHRRSVRWAGDRAEATACLRRAVEHRLVGIRPERTEPGHPGVDEARVQRRDVVVGEPHPGQRLAAVVRDEDVCLGQQSAQHLSPELAVGVDDDAALAAVHRDVLRAHDIGGCGEPGPAHVPVQLATGPLDLHDVGAHVGEVHARVRTLDRDRQVDDPDPRERTVAKVPLDHGPGQ